jgi:hypothetical protein
LIHAALIYRHSTSSYGGGESLFPERTGIGPKSDGFYTTRDFEGFVEDDL